ncbi:hypothetical protein D3C73_1205800 [compost metagenome]
MLAGVVEQLHQQIKAGQDDEHPHQLISDEACGGNIADQQCTQRGQHAQAGEGIQEAGDRGAGGSMVACGRHGFSRLVDAQEKGADQHGDHQ